MNFNWAEFYPGTHVCSRAVLQLWTATHCEIEPDCWRLEHAREQGGRIDVEAARPLLLQYFAIGSADSTILDVNGPVRLPVYPAEYKELALHGTEH